MAMTTKEDMLNATETLNPEDPIIESPKTLKDDIKFLKKGEVQSGDYNLKWQIKPKVKLGKLLTGDIAGAMERTSMNLEFGREFKDSDVEVVVKVGGNVAYLMSSPAGSAEASVTFTKRF